MANDGPTVWIDSNALEVDEPQPLGEASVRAETFRELPARHILAPRSKAHAPHSDDALPACGQPSSLGKHRLVRRDLERVVAAQDLPFLRHTEAYGRPAGRRAESGLERAEALGFGVPGPAKTIDRVIECGNRPPASRSLEARPLDPHQTMI